MGQITRKYGEVLNLNAQLHDLAVSMPKRIIADLLNANGSLRSTVELTHIAKGLFVENTETMPNIDTLLVRYYTYENDGVTLDDDYIVSEDRFMLYAAITIGDSVEGLVGDNDELIGTADVTTIEGSIYAADEITGTINDTDLVEGIANEC